MPKPEPLLHFVNPTHILYGNKPPRVGGTLKTILREEFEKKEKITWINSPVAYRNTLLHLSTNPDIFDENFLCEFNDFAICEIHPTVGKGVFATNFIKKGTLIGIYAGILDVTHGRNPSPYNLFCFRGEKLFYYDSLHYRNMTAYIQHAPAKTSSDIASANIISDVKTQRGVPVSCFISTRDIEPYEQLLFDYGEYYWGEKSFLFFDHRGLPTLNRHLFSARNG